MRPMSELFLTFLLALLGGVLGSLAHKWGLERKIGQLEIELYDLKERLLIEIKKRASVAGKRAKEFEDEILAAAVKAPPQEPVAQFWWMPHMKPKDGR